MKYDTGKTMIVGQISSREVSEMWKSEILYNEIWLNFIDYFTHNSSTAPPAPYSTKNDFSPPSYPSIK